MGSSFTDEFFLNSETSYLNSLIKPTELLPLPPHPIFIFMLDIITFTEKDDKGFV